MKRRDAKKLNIIVRGLPTSPDDCASFCHLVDKELNLKPHVSSVKRLISKTNKNTTSPPPLLIVLRDAQDRHDLLSKATKLRLSADAAVQSSIFINRDLTSIERNEGFALRSELRRRKAAGELDIGIRRGAIVKLPATVARP
jgi:hypothetical protein